MGQFRYLIAVLAVLLSGILVVPNTYAVSQFSRKYNTNCRTCHTQIPRLNYYGEKFKMNGYQDIDAKEDDGGTAKKKAYGDVDLGNPEGVVA